MEEEVEEEGVEVARLGEVGEGTVRRKGGVGVYTPEGFIPCEVVKLGVVAAGRNLAGGSRKVWIEGVHVLYQQFCHPALHSRITHHRTGGRQRERERGRQRGGRRRKEGEIIPHILINLP